MISLATRWASFAYGFAWKLNSNTGRFERFARQ
jgi:hypothetical protein